MSNINIQQLQIIQRKILSNIQELQKLVKEAEELHVVAESLPQAQKEIVERYVKSITAIIKQLTDQTLEMFNAFREFVK